VAVLISSGQISLLLTRQSIKLGNRLLDKKVEPSFLGTCENRLNNTQENVL